MLNESHKGSFSKEPSRHEGRVPVIENAVVSFLRGLITLDQYRETMDKEFEQASHEQPFIQQYDN